MMTKDQARALLGIAATATHEQVRTAYRAALKTAHPDHGGTDERLRLIIEAFQTLDEKAKPAREGPVNGAAKPAGTLEITPVLAVVGGRVTTRLADGRRVAITLPAGLRQGDRVALKDAVLSILIKGRREMFVSGDDLCILVPASAAVLQEGGRVKVKTPTGPKTIWAPKQVGTNHIVRIPGQGLPATARHKQGALILKLVAEKGPKAERVRMKARKFAGAWAEA